MLIRSYEPADCETLAELFRRSVHAVCAGDYTPKQLDAWALGRVDLAAWNRSFLEHHTLVAVEGDIVVGFGDMDRTGYLDRLFVHPVFQRRGIAFALYNDFLFQDYTATLPKIDIPLLICCAKSPAIPRGLEMGRYYRDLVGGNCCFHEFHDLGHVMFLEDPEQFNETVLYFVETYTRN